MDKEINKIRVKSIIEKAIDDSYQQGRSDAIDEFAEWLVNQGILGSRVISDGEITDYGKIYAKQFKKSLVHRNNNLEN